MVREGEAGTAVDAASLRSAHEAAVSEALSLLPRWDDSVGVASLVGAAAGATDRGDETSELRCSVCGGALDLSGSSEAEAEGEWVMPLPCGHVFHARACILPWLIHNTTCPLCRENVFDAGGAAAGGGAHPVACLSTTR